MKAKSPERSPENDRVTFSLSKELLEKIDAAARADQRSRSQWLVIQLGKILADLDAIEAERRAALQTTETLPEAPQPLSLVAEQRTSSHFTRAVGGAAVKYPAGRTRKKSG